MTSNDNGITADDPFTVAPEGKAYQCFHCGRWSRSRAGWDPDGKRTSMSLGWDVSCMMNCELKDYPAPS